MSYSTTAQGGTTTYGVMEYICDTLADKDTLPTDDISIGSSCIVLADSSVWMLGNDRTWHQL